MAKKVIKISTSIAEDMPSSAVFGVHVMARLREAGVPVIGSTWPVGVTYGTLAMHTEYDISEGDSLVYTWGHKRGEKDPGHVVGDLFAGETPDNDEDDEL